jgi:hypothetical protein
MLLIVPEHRVYPSVACKVVYDCPSCGGVFVAWATPLDPLVPMEKEAKELRARVIAKRRADAQA